MKKNRQPEAFRMNEPPLSRIRRHNLFSDYWQVRLKAAANYDVTGSKGRINAIDHVVTEMKRTNPGLFRSIK